MKKVIFIVLIFCFNFCSICASEVLDNNNSYYVSYNDELESIDVQEITTEYDGDLIKRTYVVDLYASGTTYTTTSNALDDTYSVRNYITLTYYKQDRSNGTYYLLTNVSGHWVIEDSSISVDSALLDYTCSGLENATQTTSRNVSNNYSYNTGFTTYNNSIFGCTGAKIKLTFRMGRTRTWSYTYRNELYTNSFIY